MTASTLPISSPEPNWDRVPAFRHEPSPFHWGVMLYGGVSPRTGFALEPLEFQFFAKHYSRAQIEQRARDLCEREFRTEFVIREPVSTLTDAALLGLAKGQRKYARDERRTGGRL